MKSCPICRGEKRIRLPVHHELSLRADAPAKFDEMVENVRTYPCPECSAGDIPVGVALTGAHQTIRRVEPQHRAEMIGHIKKSMATAIGHELLKEELISWKEEDVGFDSLELTALIGVASKGYTARLDNNVSVRASEMLSGITDTASAKIYNWGSHYSGNGGTIDKGMAVQFMREAFADYMRKANPEAWT